MSEATLAKINDIQKVTDAVAVGDLSQRVDVDGSGDELDSLKNSVNNMVNKLAQFDNEVSNIYPEFDCERVLGGAARPDLRGSWRELFNLVNRQAATSTNQTRSLAQVTKAVALGDLSRLMDHDVTGEMLELKNTVNVMVLRLRTMVTTIMRMVEDVGKGNLGSQVDLNELDGVWLELGQKVSNMSTNVTEHVRSVHVTIAAINRGEVHTKLPAAQHQGEFRTVGECVSTLVDLISNLSVEISRVVENGRQGQLDEPTRITSDFPGMWAGILNDVEMFARTLTSQTHSLTVALTALSDGDFSKAMDGDFEGEMLTLKDTVNFIRSQLIGLERSLFLILRPRRVEVSKRVACKGTWKDIV
ncbi:hypothetical protein DL96DRAFT_1475947 [Flagelloscypha sp. PMI_526]|nr:hypothetical protein DL96DRAFT_1475947 [Flagelloscypha sp. PMI_526]